MRSPLTLLAVAAVLLSTVAAGVTQQRRTGAFDQSINHSAIKYLTADTDTVVDRMNRRLRDGSAKLVFDANTGYLKSVLELLQVPVESQVMVYTQTSLQAQHIRMTNPRAIYFNDTVSVGYIRGAGLIEVVAQDPKMGSIFYVVREEPAAPATFGRDQQCLRCHLSWDTLGVPGMSVLTTFPRKSESDYANGGVVDHFRPIPERWGGWYVTGTRLPPRHMGNLPLIMPTPVPPPPARASLEGLFDLSGYLTPYSDIVALMVLEHQAHFSNLVTRAAWETRLGDEMRVAEAADALAEYMLFVDEARIPGGGIEGSSGFAAKFTAAGPKDAKGRSLRELDLKTRLQKYPLSYMIYSPAFRALPDAPRNLVMGKIERVLSGATTGPQYAHLTPEIRTAIREILHDTVEPP
ncbi:MAG: hypothetical protein ABI039_14355 [Vicinamibacterales bacterium]